MRKLLFPIFCLLLPTACASSDGATTRPAPGLPTVGAKPQRGRELEPLAASTSTTAFVKSDSCPRTSESFLQPIAVVEDFGVPRYPPVISFPIAFARDAKISSLTGFFATTLDGRPLPTQLEPLSRWGDGPVGCGAPVRWAYAHVLADLLPKSRGYLAIKHENDHNESREPTLSIEQLSGKIFVDTGTARFTIDGKAFVGLSKVEVKTDDGFTTLSEVTSPNAAGLLIERQGKVFSSAYGRPATLEIERNGPHVATIAAKGTYGQKNVGEVYRYTVRMSFYAGTGAVSFDHTYYNGALKGIGAEDGDLRTLVDRVFLRLPLRIGSTPEVLVRAKERVHKLNPVDTVSVQQDKRSPERPAAVFGVTDGAKNLELGVYADRPMIAASGDGLYAVATLGYMAPRDPQALRFESKTSAIDVDFQSEELFVGGARGIWAKAVLDFGALTPKTDLALRGTQLYAHATRPLIGAPATAYLNSIGVRNSLPTGELPGAYSQFDEDVDRFHETTADYLRKYRITGTQIWPDISRTVCSGSQCSALEEGYFEGGDCNYWDWSLIELESFYRTADPSFLHDFAIPQAMTMSETISFRPDPWNDASNSFSGFSPCYAGAREPTTPWMEGLNHRRHNCPGDYSYNKIHQHAYILTGDRRFTDFFTQGADTVLRLYVDPRKTKPTEWLELSASRSVYQYLEQLLNAAEFGRIGGDERNRKYRDTAIVYFDHMTKTSLERGHTCNLLGSGMDDPKEKLSCVSDQAWMLPVWLDWVARLHRLYNHAPAKAWILDWVKMSARRHTGVDDDEVPGDDSRWRTMYRCEANRKGIRDETCKMLSEGIENGGRFYNNGIVAFLNAYAIALDVDPQDPAKICSWLPDAYAQALRGMGDTTNGYVYGKEIGQAYALTQSALGAIERCK